MVTDRVPFWHLRWTFRNSVWWSVNVGISIWVSLFLWFFINPLMEGFLGTNPLLNYAILFAITLLFFIVSWWWQGGGLKRLFARLIEDARNIDLKNPLTWMALAIGLIAIIALSAGIMWVSVGVGNLVLWGWFWVIFGLGFLLFAGWLLINS